MADRINCPIDTPTQTALRRLKPKTGSHTETVRHAVNLLALIARHLDAGGTLVTGDGRQLSDEEA